MSTVTAERNYLVQRAATRSTEWQTLCTNPNLEYAEEVYQKQLQVYCTGKFRLLDPDGNVLQLQEARPMFSNN
jgi:hypothetical protein